MTAGQQHGGAFVSALVLAAGMARRMGRQKVLLPLAGAPLVRHVVDAAMASTVSETIVVVGHEATAVREVLAGCAVSVVVNDRFAEGMSGSLRTGLAAVDPACAAVVVLLGDSPFVEADVIDRLIERFVATGSPVVRPVVAGRPANPVLLSAALFPEVRAQRGDVGGREVVDRHRHEMCLVPVDDPRLAADIDSPEDYSAAGGSL